MIQIIHKHWDCFCKEGSRRTILGYEFGIDTGDSKPVFCKKPAYGPCESKIIMYQVQKILANGWTKLCKGPWGSLVVLVDKPNQENVTNIDKLIWRICVSYQKFNGFTKLFQYPIPRCAEAITVLNVGAHRILIITLDARQGYHKVSVRPTDKEKMDFWHVTIINTVSVLCLLDQPTRLTSIQP